MLRIAATTLVLFTFSAQARIASEIRINANKALETAKQAAQNFTFGYHVKYLGPSLSPDMQEGSTFNRFKTGQDNYGNEYDSTASHQTYQAFKLGYKLPKNMRLSYGVTYQDDVKKGVEYDNYSSTGIREYGRSYNNHQISLFIPAVYSNDLFFVGTNLYYERPTTESSIEAQMQYGLGIQPSIGFYSKTPGLFYGAGLSIERDVYPDNEYTETSFPNWCLQPGYTCEGIKPNRYLYKRQTLRASVSPYLNYMLTDHVTLKSSLSFDWDQKGDKADSLEFTNNMEDVYEVGASYRFNSNVSASAGLEGSISKPDLRKTAVFGSLNLNI